MPRNTDAFEALCRIEPRLCRLFERAKRIAKNEAGKVCPLRVWHGYWQFGQFVFGMKSELEKLVGDGARKRDPRLASCAGYDCGYQTIFNALPDCGPHCCLP
jgi:hypothetical protein